MISTSFIIGTGLKKCMPMKRPGRSVAAASRVIGIDDVLDAKKASGFSTGQREAKIFFLISSFSVAASITMSQSAKALLSVAVTMRAKAASRSALLTLPLLTCRSMFFAMVASARSSACCCTSISTTGMPDSAATWAMPLPISPAPITPSLLIAAMMDAPVAANLGAAHQPRAPSRQITSCRVRLPIPAWP